MRVSGLYQSRAAVRKLSAAPTVGRVRPKTARLRLPVARDYPRSGRRLLTLVPDHHICIVTGDQIAGTVPEAPPTPDAPPILSIRTAPCPRRRGAAQIDSVTQHFDRTSAAAPGCGQN